MSLLMDALKKAEQAKQQGSSTQAHGIAEAAPPAMPEAVTPANAASASSGRAPGMQDLPPLKLEDLDAEFIAHARGETPPAPSRPSVDRRTEQSARAGAPLAPQPISRPAPATDAIKRDAVRNAFAAKQPPGPVNRTFGLVVGAITLLAVAAIGIYFWIQLKPATGLARPGVTTALRTDQPAMPIQETPAAAAATTPLPPATSPAPSAAPIREIRKPESAKVRPAASSDGAIHVATSRMAINPTLQRAYDTLQAGDLAAAKTAYSRVLEGEPRNIDALQGLAAIAVREGRGADAGAYYLRILEADPRDGAALAGLIGLNGQSDPIAGESRIKTLLAVQPDLPVLHFALGNLYARQNRWSEAQQAYFKACSGDPDNPDYLFNLAVSLDQLHQAAPAAQYYRKALATAAARPAGFDHGQASARLRELQP